MASTLGRLTVDLMAKTAGIEKGTREGRKQFRELEKSVQKAEKTINASMAAATAATAAYAAAVAKITVDEIKLIATQADLADSLNATVTGLRSVNALAGDNSIGDLDSSLARLNRRLGAVENGGGPAANAIKALNLSTQALGAADADEKLAIIADAIQKSGVSAQQATRYLQDLGFQQQGVYNLFKDGGDAIREYRGQIEATGQAINAIEAVKIQQAAVAFSALGDVWKGIKTQLATQLAPIVKAVADKFNEMGREGVDAASFVETAIDKTTSVITFVADAIEGVRRTFDVAGKAIAWAMLRAHGEVLSLADAIVGGPNYAIDQLIQQINRIPGVNIEYLGQSDLSKDIQRSLADVQGAIRVAAEDIQDTLLEPMPSEKINAFIKSAKEAAEKAAQETLNTRKELNTQAVELDNEQVAAEKMALDSRIQNLLNYGLTKEEELFLQHEQELELIKDLHDQKKIAEDEAIAASLASQQKYNDAMAALNQEQFTQRLQTAKTALGNLSTLMNSHSRKAFEIGKAAAYANTIINTSEAAMAAYKSLAGIPIVGPGLGAAAAAAAIAAGAVQLQQISRTKLGGGSAGVSNTQAVSNAAEPVAQAQQAPRDIYIRGIGASDILTGEQVINLLNDEVLRGGKIVGAGA